MFEEDTQFFTNSVHNILIFLQACSVFLFSKQTPDFEKLHKREREQILEMLRKGPTQLVRLKHPRLLTIDHPLEESK